MAMRERLDVRGLLCPLPVLRTAARVAVLGPGGLLEVLADDPLFRLDVEAWCAREGHELVGLEESDGQVRCLLRIGTERAGSVQ